MRIKKLIPANSIQSEAIYNQIQLHSHAIILDSNNYIQEQSKVDLIAAWGFHKLVTLGDLSKGKINDWVFGYLSFDYKNQLENLTSEHSDGVNAPELCFFIPEVVIYLQNDVFTMEYFNTAQSKIDSILNPTPSSKNKQTKTFEAINAKTTTSDYLETVQRLKTHIKKGDIYEINYCTEFYNDNCTIDPIETYQHMLKVSPTPFACYFKTNHVHVMGASPERFLQRIGNKVISQPIKGTARRGRNVEEDEKIKHELANSLKNQSENVMIVDLVRNDLSRIAKPNTVKVDELFGVYTFPQVHQLISTISCEVDENTSPMDIIDNCFPPGSMTGAPKIKAMQLIEEYENVKRGIYSGCIGYIAPNGDFDFNVVIRSIIYNSDKRYLSFMVGGAITDKSDPHDEYEECMLKAKAMIDTLNFNKSDFHASGIS